METSHEFQLLHRFEPAFCNPVPFEVGEPISHLFRDSLNQVAHLGSAQKQCMSNACKYSTFFLPWNVLRRLQILCSFCAMPNAITLITKTIFVCRGIFSSELLLIDFLGIQKSILVLYFYLFLERNRSSSEFHYLQ